MNNKSDQAGAREEAEYSEEMLMLHFMEIRRRAKRQQIHQHLFAFDALAQNSAIQSAEGRLQLERRGK